VGHWTEDICFAVNSLVLILTGYGYRYSRICTILYTGHFGCRLHHPSRQTFNSSDSVSRNSRYFCASNSAEQWGRTRKYSGLRVEVGTKILPRQLLYHSVQWISKKRSSNIIISVLVRERNPTAANPFAFRAVIAIHFRIRLGTGQAKPAA
jgi:hypothetical protein